MKSMETRQSNPVVWLVLAIVLAIGLMAVFAALFTPFGTGTGMMGSGMGWGALFMVVPAFVLILILLAALGTFSPSRAYHATGSALENLNVRYARGEISRDEYVRVRADLEGAKH